MTKHLGGSLPVAWPGFPCDRTVLLLASQTWFPHCRDVTKTLLAHLPVPENAVKKEFVKHKVIVPSSRISCEPSQQGALFVVCSPGTIPGHQVPAATVLKTGLAWHLAHCRASRIHLLELEVIQDFSSKTCL